VSILVVALAPLLVCIGGMAGMGSMGDTSSMMSDSGGMMMGGGSMITGGLVLLLILIAGIVSLVSRAAARVAMEVESGLAIATMAGRTVAVLGVAYLSLFLLEQGWPA
jgi:hypothetical protein